jgi:hypothetical protein
MEDLPVWIMFASINGFQNDFSNGKNNGLCSTNAIFAHLLTVVQPKYFEAG